MLERGDDPATIIGLNLLARNPARPLRAPDDTTTHFAATQQFMPFASYYNNYSYNNKS